MVSANSLSPSLGGVKYQSNHLRRAVLTAQQIAVLLLVGDISILLGSLQVAFWMRSGDEISLSYSSALSFVSIFIGSLYLADTYRPNLQVSGLRAPARTLISNLVASGVWAIVIYIFGVWGQGAIFGRGVWPVATIMFGLWTVCSRLLAAKQLKVQANASSWLLLGFGRRQQTLVEDFKALRLSDNVVTLLTPEQEEPHDLDDDSIGRLEDLEAWLTQPWDNILLNNGIELNEQQWQQLKQRRLEGLAIYRVSDLYESYFNKLPSSSLQNAWFAFSAGFHLLSSRISLKIKRLGDIILAASVLALVSPIMVLTAIAIKLDSRGPVFYSQLRTGQNMSPFRVYKFRSMSQDAEKRGVQWASERDPRITKVGYFIRLVRIDELPQLWNVLRGDMSMIGPRPERPEFDEKLAEEIPHYAVRYMVKPGITGWAQVLYPYGASVKDAYEKLAYDLYYIKNYSLWLDVAIVFKTLRVVLLGKGR